MSRLFFVVMLLLPGLVFAAEPTAAARQEVAHLIGYLRESGCEFNRNGTWYGAEEAVAHLNRKYEYLLDKGLVISAEDFVDRAASESSMSGQPYLVKCGTASPVQSGSWFKAELVRYRAGRR